MLEQAINITAVNGYVVASTNHSGITMSDFNKTIKNSFAKQGRKYHVETTFEQPVDFASIKGYPESAYLKVVILKVLS
ncbi:methyltransferase [Brochothrix thermosphacta DSM 20171 = FSL F6-1036]|nr:methyltransferase [Brochothrix thermosphacta DSM 20171 = FSL F6-1036]